MENASKALYMAAAILVSVMIISIFVYIFRAGAQFGEKYGEKQNKEQIELFNSRFLFFQKENNTISDMLSVINLASNVNENANFNLKNGVTIEIVMGNKWFSIIPSILIEKNYVFIGKADSITSSSQKMYIYDFMNIAKNNLVSYNGTTLQKTVSPLGISFLDWEDDENLSKVQRNDENDIVYKFLFNCTDLEFNGDDGKISYLKFELKKNDDYIDSTGP